MTQDAPPKPKRAQSWEGSAPRRREPADGDGGGGTGGRADTPLRSGKAAPCAAPGPAAQSAAPLMGRRTPEAVLYSVWLKRKSVRFRDDAK
jgi:hypothetical protein